MRNPQSTYLNGEKRKATSLRLEKRQCSPAPSLPFHIELKVLAETKREKTEGIQKIQMGKDAKLSLFADELILYISRSSKFYQKTRNNKFSNVRLQNQLVCTRTYTHTFLLTTNMQRNHGHVPIHSIIKEIKISRNKTHKGNEEPLQ